MCSQKKSTWSSRMPFHLKGASPRSMLMRRRGRTSRPVKFKIRDHCANP